MCNKDGVFDMCSLEKLKENSVWYDANLFVLSTKYRNRYMSSPKARCLAATVFFMRVLKRR